MENHRELGVPDGLVQEINRGNCVAFVGAGFSAAAELPGWIRLLQRMAEAADVDPEHRTAVFELTASTEHRRPSAHALDQAAQMLADHLGPERFISLLREFLATTGALPSRMERRLQRLHAVPFRAILTTNFDGLLRGDTPGGAAYRRILRNERSHWWQSAFWAASPTGARTLTLHGSLREAPGSERIVFTREDYRRRLYGDPAYATFLRSIFSTSTVLYLGFSFEDAYLNELRSEVLSLFGHAEDDSPIAYAVLNDVNRATEAHFRRHEGIHVLPFSSTSPPDFGGFDGVLDAIHERTSPLSRFGALLAGKRLLWLDAHAENNDYGVEFLKRAAETGSGAQHPIVMIAKASEALARIEEAQSRHHPFDLVISHWGTRSGREPAGVELLTGMRARDLRSPVIIFSNQTTADERKRKVLALGALAYCFKFDTLFRRIEETFAAGVETG